MHNLYLRLEEIGEFENWIESVLKNYTLGDYYLLSDDIQEEVETMYAQGEFYAALDLINSELDKII